MRELVRAVFAFARDVIRAETLTEEGRLNAFGIFIVFVLMLAAGVFDVLQAAVRVVKSDYTTGLPSTLAVLGIFAGLLLACITILRLVPPKAKR